MNDESLVEDSKLSFNMKYSFLEIAHCMAVVVQGQIIIGEFRYCRESLFD